MGFYGDSVFAADKAEKKVSVEESSIIKEYDEILIEAYHEGLYSIQEAKYTFLPKFQRNEELKKYEKDAKEAEDLVAQLDPTGKTKDDVANAMTAAKRVGRMALRILEIVDNVVSVVSTAYCISIIWIPFHMLIRLIVWAERTGQEALAKSECEDVIRKLKKIAASTKDKKVKEAAEEEVKKLEQRLKDLDRNINNKSET